MNRNPFVYGTAGWAYKDWRGVFYPAGTPDSDFLACYADQFPGVEIDSTYYGIPRISTTAAWAAATPASFLFSPKMIGEVTHERFLLDCDELLAKYLASLEPLGEKLGPVVLQFPYYKKADGVTLEGFLDRLLPFLDKLPDRPRFAVEVRNKAFLRPALLEELRQRRIALVLIDHIWMPSPQELLRRADELFTAEFVPIRLLGDRYGIERLTATWDRTVVDREEALAAWARLIRMGLSRGLPANAFANNHYAGFAPVTARRLAELVASPDSPA